MLFFRTVPSANTLVRWVNENAFVLEVQTRPCPTFGRPVHLGFPHRLRPGTSPHALRIPPHGGHPAPRGPASGSPASEAINPAFGYGAPHLSARGTLTPLNNALLSAHFSIADDSLGTSSVERLAPQCHRRLVSVPSLKIVLR